MSLPQDRASGLYTEGATTAEFLRKLDISLKRLGLEYVEILYHHGVSRKESVVHEPVLIALEKAKKEGKIQVCRYFDSRERTGGHCAATDSKMYDVILTAYNFKQKHYAEVREAIAKAAQSGLGFVGMKAIRGGYRQTPTVKNSAAALKWVLQDSNVHIVVPGFTTFEEMNVDLRLCLSRPDGMLCAMLLKESGKL